MKLNLAAAFTFLASLWMPLHLLPWISWHNEVWTFVAVGLLVLASMTSSAEGLHQKQIGLPKAAWPILVLCFVSVVQVSTGAIGFLGDAVVINFYLALCVGALIVGVDHGLRNSHSDAGASYNNPNIEFFAMVVLLGGAGSAVIAFAQVFDVWPDAEWIVRMSEGARPGGNLAQPNQLATLILFALASLVYLFEARRIAALTTLALGLVLLLGLVITESRTGVLSFLLIVLWWVAKRRSIPFAMSGSAVALSTLFFLTCFWLFPGFANHLQEGGASQATTISVNTAVGTRVVIWPQLWQAVLMHPWFGWGLREVSTAHNAVLGGALTSEPFTYAHNILLDLAIGVGLPLAFVMAASVALWVWRRALNTSDILGWYCLAFILPLCVHSLLEFPFAYAYLLAPVLFIVGVMEAKNAVPGLVWIRLRVVALSLMLITAVMVWSVVEYVAIEEDFRVARFEALRIGHTPDDYERPHIVLLSQLDALLDGARIVPAPLMERERIELARKVALRFPWPATQNRYALSLALNGNSEEALRQINVMRAMHGPDAYARIKLQWETLAEEKYPQLRELKMP